MSNSDKFEQDEGIVSDNGEPQLAGVLGGADAGDKAELVEDPDEKVDQDEFDGIKKDNIIDDGGLLSTVGQRGTDAPEDYGAADAKLDEQVSQVADEQNDGQSAIRK